MALLKCKNNSQAVYCCSSEFCQRPTLMCAQLSTCNTCKRNHLKCPNNIRLGAVSEIIEKNKKRQPLEMLLGQKKKVPSYKQLIAQLQKMEQNLTKSYKINQWGTNQTKLNFINKQLSKINGSYINYVLNNEQIFPDPRFCLPPQLKQDIDEVYRINAQLQKRLLSSIKIYRALAEIDCKISECAEEFAKSIKSIKSIKSMERKIKGLHQEFEKAILRRIEFGKYLEDCSGFQKKQTMKEQVENFRVLGFRLLGIMMKLIYEQLKNGSYESARITIGNCEQLFDEGTRHQFCLSREELKKQVIELNKLKGQTAFYTNEYPTSLDFYLKVQNRTADDLQKLIKLTSIMGLKQGYINYYWELYAKSEQGNRKQVLLAIRNFYKKQLALHWEKVYDEQLYRCNLGLVESQLKKEESARNYEEILEWYQQCAEYERKCSMDTKAMMHYRDILRILKIMERGDGDQRSLVEIDGQKLLLELDIREKMLSFNVNNSNKNRQLFYEEAETAIKRCETMLAIQYIEPEVVDQQEGEGEGVDQLKGKKEERKVDQLKGMKEERKEGAQNKEKKQEKVSAVENKERIQQKGPKLTPEQKIYSSIPPEKLGLNFKPQVNEYKVKFILLKLKCLPKIESLSSSQQKQAQTLSHFNQLSEVTKICKQNHVKIFEPFYERAKLSLKIYTDKEKMAENLKNIEKQLDQALNIYPNIFCYKNKAIGLYQQYYCSNYDRSYLVRAIEVVGISLKINNNQIQLWELMGVCKQILEEFQDSNAAYRQALEKGAKDSAQIYSRIGENYEFMYKKQPQLVQQKHKNLEMALQSYNKSLQISQFHEKSILGKARTLRNIGSEQSLEEALKIFQAIIDNNSKYKIQALMFMGNIIEDQASESGITNIDMLIEARKLYEKAGRRANNKGNMMRILRKLGNYRAAEQIQSQNWQIE